MFSIHHTKVPIYIIYYFFLEQSTSSCVISTGRQLRERQQEFHFAGIFSQFSPKENLLKGKKIKTCPLFGFELSYTFHKIMIQFMESIVQGLMNIYSFQIKLSFLMVRHTHEDVDQMFSRISVHLTGKAIPTLPVLQGLMRDAYHPTPMLQHLDGLGNYRELEIVSAATLQGYSGTHVFRF